MQNQKALINYYARLVHKGTYKLDQVPKDLHGAVGEAIHALEVAEHERIKSESNNAGK